MNRPRISLRPNVFGALTAASLLFGASQAFARPPGYVPLDDVTCSTADPASVQQCRRACADEGYVDGLCSAEIDRCVCQAW